MKMRYCSVSIIGLLIMLSVVWLMHSFAVGLVPCKCLPGGRECRVCPLYCSESGAEPHCGGDSESCLCKCEGNECVPCAGEGQCSGGTKLCPCGGSLCECGEYCELTSGYQFDCGGDRSRCDYCRCGLPQCNLIECSLQKCGGEAFYCRHSGCGLGLACGCERPICPASAYKITCSETIPCEGNKNIGLNACPVPGTDAYVNAECPCDEYCPIGKSNCYQMGKKKCLCEAGQALESGEGTPKGFCGCGYSCPADNNFMPCGNNVKECGMCCVECICLNCCPGNENIRCICDSIGTTSSCCRGCDCSQYQS